MKAGASNDPKVPGKEARPLPKRFYKAVAVAPGPPSPLVGEGKGGGEGRTSVAVVPPTPNPSPRRVGDAPSARGGGEHVGVCRSVVSSIRGRGK